MGNCASHRSSSVLHHARHHRALPLQNYPSLIVTVPYLCLAYRSSSNPLLRGSMRLDSVTGQNYASPLPLNAPAFRTSPLPCNSFPYRCQTTPRPALPLLDVDFLPGESPFPTVAPLTHSGVPSVVQPLSHSLLVVVAQAHNGKVTRCAGGNLLRQRQTHALTLHSLCPKRSAAFADLTGKRRGWCAAPRRSVCRFPSCMP